MVLEYKQLDFITVDESRAEDWGRYNRRAEIPILLHDDLVVLNSSDIVPYLDDAFPDRSIYPSDPRRRVAARAWERTADTLADAIVTNTAIWTWAKIGNCPEGLLAANQAEISDLYDELQAVLGDYGYICGELSIADLALFPHLMAAWHLDLRCDPEKHGRVARWLGHMRNHELGRADIARVRSWWKNRTNSTLETRRINWGSYRLELYLAQGFHRRLIDDIENDRVLWSVGPHRNSLRAAHPAS
jgi:glutathione S-transferase